MYQINSFNFTVHTEDKTFKTEIFKLINELPLIEVGFDAYKNVYMYKLNTLRLLEHECDAIWITKLWNDVKNEGNDFFSLQMINEFDYNFSFQRIAELYDFEKSKKVSYGGSFDSIMRVYSTIYGHEKIEEFKKIVANKLIKFLDEKQLLSSAKINNLSFIHNFNLSVRGSDFEDIKNKNKFKDSVLARLTENINGNLSYDYIKASVDESIYTLPIKSYQAYINDPKKMVNQYLKQNNKELLADDAVLNENDMIKYLEKIIKKVIKGTNKFEVKKATLNGYHIVADLSCNFSWNESVKIIDGIFLNFRPTFEVKKNFFGLCTINEDHEIKLYDCRGEITETEYNKLENKAEVYVSEGGDVIHKKSGGAKKDKKTTFKNSYFMRLHSTKLNMRKKYISIFEVNNWVKEDGITPYALNDLDSISLYLHEEISRYILASQIDIYDEASITNERGATDVLQDFINGFGITRIEDFVNKYPSCDNYIDTGIVNLKKGLKVFFG